MRLSGQWVRVHFDASYFLLTGSSRHRFIYFSVSIATGEWAKSRHRGIKPQGLKSIGHSHSFMAYAKTPQDILVATIAHRAEEEARHLAGEFLRAASGEKEQILAQLEYEKWLAETCWESLR